MNPSEKLAQTIKLELEHLYSCEFTLFEGLFAPKLKAKRHLITFEVKRAYVYNPCETARKIYDYAISKGVDFEGTIDRVTLIIPK